MNTHNLKDEFSKISNLTAKLFKVIMQKVTALESIYRPPTDHQKFLEMLEDDDDETTVEQHAERDEEATMGMTTTKIRTQTTRVQH